MEKSKAELYLDRLQKWREEKNKNKENKSKQILTSQRPLKQLPKPPVSRPVLKGSNSRPVSKPVKTTDRQTSAVNRKSGPTVKKLQNGISLSTVKIGKKRNSEDTRQMLAKLSKWKDEKSKSEKKQAPVSVSKPKMTHKTTDSSQPQVVKVKSRLFDYLNKPKPSNTQSVSKTDSTTGKNEASTGKSRLTMDVKQGQAPKAGLKRRYSEVSKGTGQKKPGILKRKSCIGLFDLKGETNMNSSPKRRKISVSATKTASPKSSKKEHNIVGNVDNVGTVTTEGESCTMLSEAATPCLSSRNVRFVTPPGSHIETKRLRKTPKTPATRTAELDSWLQAKGRTPSKFRHLMCFHGHGDKHAEERKDPHTKNTLSVDELSEQMNVLEQERLLAGVVKEMNSMLDECMILFEAGCPVESIVPWLDDIYKQIPVSHTSARFYTCKASVVKSTLDLDAVLEVFEQATINNAQPKEEIAKCLTETLKFVTEEKVRQAKKRSRTPRRSYIQEENIFESSAVVYTVANVTPFSEGKRSSSQKTRTPSQCQVVTPVRRSTRRSLQNLPESLKDSKRSYSNLADVEDTANLLFQPNKALEDVFADMDDV